MEATAGAGLEPIEIARLIAAAAARRPEVAAALAASLEVLLGYASDETPVAGALDAEAEAIQVAMRIVAPLLQARLQRRLDELDEGSWGQSPCRWCGGATESIGRRSRGWKGLVGLLTLRRRYSHCERCHEGHGPSQLALGLGDGAYTPRMEHVVTLLATTVPHGMAVQLVSELHGVSVSEKGAQQLVERRAQFLDREQCVEATACAPFDPTGLPRVAEPPSNPVRVVPEVAYLELDGVIPMTREELHGKELSAADRRQQRRASEQGARGGRGRRYRLVGREVKNAVLYDGANCARESPGRGCLLEKHYVSHLGNWRTFAWLLWPELRRQRFDEAKLLVLLSDGAEWIRSLAEWLPVPTLLILDLFHVKHRIWEVANALHGDHTAAARNWAETQCARIEAGEAMSVIEALRFHQGSNAAELVSSLKEYLESNRDRMDYPDYRARGLRVGSGAVESANFHVTGARLKLQGMRWSEQGAREMAYLRADLFNNRWTARSRSMAASR
jgi:hypothetical protein